MYHTVLDCLDARALPVPAPGAAERWSTPGRTSSRPWTPRPSGKRASQSRETAAPARPAWGTRSSGRPPGWRTAAGPPGLRRTKHSPPKDAAGLSSAWAAPGAGDGARESGGQASGAASAWRPPAPGRSTVPQRTGRPSPPLRPRPGEGRTSPSRAAPACVPAIPAERQALEIPGRRRWSRSGGTLADRRGGAATYIICESGDGVVWLIDNTPPMSGSILTG